MSCKFLYSYGSMAPSRGNYPEALYQNTVLFQDAQIIETKLRSLLGLFRDTTLSFTFWGHVDRAASLSGNAPSSQWEDIQVSGGNWGNDNLMSSTLSSFFKSMIQRIGLPWTFHTSEASQGHEYSDIPGEKTMADKVEMRNDLFRSLDPIAKS